MTDGEALRQAVLAEPDEDTPRLIYADWLDENGQPARAEFIRAQIEAVRAEPYSLKATNAARRADLILELNRQAWTRHVHGVIRPHFRRGFVEHLEIEPQSFIPSAAALFSVEPIQSLHLYRFASPSGPVELQPLFEQPELGRVRCLEFAPRLDPTTEEFDALANCLHLRGLRRLSLRGNPVPPAWLTSLLGGRLFPELCDLDLADITNLGPSMVNAFERAGHRNIRRLDASEVVFTSEQLKRVLSAECLRGVEELRLRGGGRLREPGPLFHLDLGWVLSWDRLVLLDLARQHLGDESVREFVRKPEAANLRWLGLAYNRLGPESVRLLVGTSHLALNYLDVSGNGFTTSQLAALHSRFPNAIVNR